MPGVFGTIPPLARARCGCHLAELLGSGQSVEAGHPDVEQGDVRPVPEREFDGLASVSGLGDYLKPRIRRHDGANADPDHHLVVGQQESPGQRRVAEILRMESPVAAAASTAVGT